jgi:hypothetical protein
MTKQDFWNLIDQARDDAQGGRSLWNDRWRDLGSKRAEDRFSGAATLCTEMLSL